MFKYTIRSEIVWRIDLWQFYIFKPTGSCMFQLELLDFRYLVDALYIKMLRKIIKKYWLIHIFNNLEFL